MPDPDPRSIWPAGLERLAGEYVFVQVASPGGLWERFVPAAPRAKMTSRQVSLGELPKAFRDMVSAARITISGLELPSEVGAEERTSPSGRGKLRFYREAAEGQLLVRGLPGVGGGDRDKGSFRGRVLFVLEHQSHSNPSVTGVFQQRLNQEATWGAATLDYADLLAVPTGDETAPGATGEAAKNGKATPARPAGARPQPAGAPPAKQPAPSLKNAAPGPDAGPHEDHDEERSPVIGNARVMRNGLEVFAFVEWEQKAKDGTRHYSGSVRLMRRNPAATPAANTAR